MDQDSFEDYEEKEFENNFTKDDKDKKDFEKEKKKEKGKNKKKYKRKGYNKSILLLCDNSGTLKLTIWDTAGRERYGSFVKIFFKDADAIIMTYDITNRSTFEQIKEYYSELIKEYCSPEVIVIIAGNNPNLLDKEQVDENEVREFASSINASFALVSPKDLHSFNELFFEIVRKYTGCQHVEKLDDEYENDYEPIKKKEVNENNKSKKSIKIKKFEENKKQKKNGCHK